MSRTDHLVTLFARENSQLPEATMAESQEKEITSMEPDSAKDHLLEGQLYDKDFSGQNLREADMSRRGAVLDGAEIIGGDTRNATYDQQHGSLLEA
jgi:uncharacterized protein YjbI with pentapeptide repeats